jgi:hypothetical protein
MSKGIGNRQEISRLEARRCLTPYSIGITAGIVIKFYQLSKRDNIRSHSLFKLNQCHYCFQEGMLSVLLKLALEKR